MVLKHNVLSATHTQGLSHPLNPCRRRNNDCSLSPVSQTSSSKSSFSHPDQAERDPLNLLSDLTSVQILSTGILQISSCLQRCFVGAMTLPQSLQPSLAADAPNHVEPITAHDSANAETIMDELMQVHQAPLSSYLPAYYDDGDESLDTKELVISKGGFMIGSHPLSGCSDDIAAFDEMLVRHESSFARDMASLGLYNGPLGDFLITPFGVPFKESKKSLRRPPRKFSPLETQIAQASTRARVHRAVY